MRKSLILIGLLLLVSGAALAQDAPKAEVAGNYTYVRFSGGANCNGGGGSVTGYLDTWLGVVGDFSGCHFSGGGSASTYMFGPKFVYRGGKMDPYFQFLFGGTHVTGGNAFSMTIGGGVDFKVAPHIALRPAQIEYYMTHFGGFRQNNFRYSAGVVLRFGER